MDDFWHFARMIWAYPRLITYATVGALFDALCAAGGIGTIIWLGNQFFGEGTTARLMLIEKLGSPKVQHFVGDQTWVAGLVPEGAFSGFVFLLALIFLLSVLGSVGRFVHQFQAYTISMNIITRVRQRMFQRMLNAAELQVPPFRDVMLTIDPVLNRISYEKPEVVTMIVRFDRNPVHTIYRCRERQLSCVCIRRTLLEERVT